MVVVTAVLRLVLVASGKLVELALGQVGRLLVGVFATAGVVQQGRLAHE